jgi:hypothetical protein
MEKNDRPVLWGAYAESDYQPYTEKRFPGTPLADKILDVVWRNSYNGALGFVRNNAVGRCE